LLQKFSKILKIFLTDKIKLFFIAHRPHSVWTGYFTSRAALKYYVRKGSNYLQGFRKFFTFYKMDNNPVELLERAMGVVQHHDGVSGTERQHVAYDYAKRLAIGIDEALSYYDAAEKINPNFLNKSVLI
jgi:hypothetical protein